jgi:glycogen(starch) synthase
VRRLLVLTTGELTRDPRARRAVQSAGRYGYDVVGLCVSAEEPDVLEGVDVTRVQRFAFDAALRGAGLGGMRRSSLPVRELRGLYRVLRHVVVTLQLVRAGRRLNPVDVIHANDFDTLPAAFVLARTMGARLVYDAHEIYTQQEACPAKLYTAVIVAIERALAGRADAVITVNDEIAQELRQLLRLKAQPLVVMNCAALDPVEPDHQSTGRMRVVYQGAMGPGRQIEDLLDMAEHAPGIHLTIRVIGTDLEALSASVAERELEDRVEIATPVAPSALVEALRGHHVGLMINRPITRNDEFALPNKLFEYLMAGLAVVGPDLPCLHALITGQEVGLTFEPGNTDDLANVLMGLDADRELLSRLRGRARHIAVTHLNAETQAVVLECAWSGA